MLRDDTSDFEVYCLLSEKMKQWYLFLLHTFRETKSNCSMDDSELHTIAVLKHFEAKMVDHFYKGI